MRRTAPTRVATAELSASRPIRRDVEPLLHQVDRPIDQAERGRYLGKAAEELGHDRQDMQAPEQDRRGDAQFAARRRTLPRRGPLDFLEIGKHAARPRQKPVPGLGEADRAGGAIEEPHPEPRFQFANRARNRGRGASEPARSRGKTAAFGHFDENRGALDATHIYCIYRNNILYKGILQSEMKRSTFGVIIAVRTHIP